MVEEAEQINKHPIQYQVLGEKGRWRMVGGTQFLHNAKEPRRQKAAPIEPSRTC